jgi:hypothetical protein
MNLGKKVWGKKAVTEYFLKGYSISAICRAVGERYNRKPLARTRVEKIIKDLGLTRVKEDFRYKLKLITDINADIETAREIIGLDNYKNIQEKDLKPLLKGALTKMDKFLLLDKLKKFPEIASIKIVGQDTNVHQSVLYDNRKLTRKK